MISDGDYVQLNGDFVTDALRDSNNNPGQRLIAGTLEVKGNFAQ